MPAAANKTMRSASASLPRTISVAAAKANFSSLISGVEKKHAPVTILRRGVPVAQIVPVPGRPAPQLRGSMAGTVRVLGDIVSHRNEEWTVSDE